MIITGKKFSKPARSRVINGDVVLSDAKKSGKNLPGAAALTGAANPANPTPAPDKIRLDHLLVQKYPEYNRNTLQKFIKAGYVSVNNQVVKKPNTLIELLPPSETGTSTTEPSANIPAAQIQLRLPESSRQYPEPSVIYEDAHVLVLNKPAGLLSMAKGAYCPEKTLEDYGLLVHRLDRDTSGVVILAKDPETQKLLRKQFQDRKTHKTYYAIVEGRPKHDEALIDLPINRNYKHPNTFLIEPGGKPSQTHYKVLQSNDKFSLLELKPTTGRTHQLRVHLQYLGTPILGDSVYGTCPYHHSDPESVKAAARQSGQGTTAPRLFLHAYQLEITIPDGDRRTFTAPLPPEFTNFFKS